MSEARSGYVSERWESGRVVYHAHVQQGSTGWCLRDRWGVARWLSPFEAQKAVDAWLSALPSGGG